MNRNDEMHLVSRAQTPLAVDTGRAAVLRQPGGVGTDSFNWAPTRQSAAATAPADVDGRSAADSRPSDDDIAATALEAIKWITTIPAESVAVTVSKGRLFLDGAVECWSQKEAVESAVRDLPGVVVVHNLMTARFRETKSDLKDAIKASFERLALHDADNIDVAVDGPRVTLRGLVSSLIERENAESAVRSATNGKSEVENLIAVA